MIEVMLKRHQQWCCQCITHTKEYAFTANLGKSAVSNPGLFIKKQSEKPKAFKYYLKRVGKMAAN